MVALLNEANSTLAQKMMRYQHDAMTEMCVEEAQKRLEGVAGGVTQMQARMPIMPVRAPTGRGPARARVFPRMG